MTPRLGWWMLRITLVAAAVSMGAGCFPFAQDTPAPLRVGRSLRAEYVVSGAARPSTLAPAVDGRIFYAEKETGQIRVIVDGALASAPFATVPVNFAGDRGLLGLALHPDFASNGRVYVFYTRSDTGQATDDPEAVIDHRIVYFTAQGDVAAGGEVFVASFPVGPGTSQVGGRLAFAPDGKLLVGIGDLADPEQAANPGVPPGKILRFNDDGTIPADNPAADSTVLARGFHDVTGLTIDPADGAAVALDRNQGGHEEINRVQAGGNYGWPSVVGLADTTSEMAFVAENPDYVDPAYESQSGRPGVVGGSFDPSSRYGPNTRGQLFYGESSNRRVRRVQFSADGTTTVTRTTFADGFPSDITDVVFTPAGTLYVACRNAIFRIVPTQ